MPLPFPRLLIAGLLAAVFLHVARADDQPSAESLYQNAPKGLPSEPAWGYWPKAPEAWLIVHKQFVDRTHQGNVDIVFIGDSITKGWGLIEKTNWAETTPALKAVNYGIGGDTTRQILWRIDHGVLDGIDPKLVVLMIGTNNLYVDHNSGTNEEIVDGVKTCIARIQQKAPTARVLLLGVLPRQTAFWSQRIIILNRLLSALEKPDRVQYYDASPLFAGPDALPKTELYGSDLVHLNSAGYEVLTAAIKPLTVKLLKRAPLPAPSK